MCYQWTTPLILQILGLMAWWLIQKVAPSLPLFHCPTLSKSHLCLLHLYHTLLHLHGQVGRCGIINNLLGTLILILNLCDLSTTNLLQLHYYHVSFSLCAIDYGRPQIHLISFVNIFIDHHLIPTPSFHLKTFLPATNKWTHLPYPHQHHLPFIAINQSSC